MAIELSAWVTPAVVVAVGALLLRSMSRLGDRLDARIDETNKNLGTRIDETNKRIDEINKSLSARIDETNKSLGARIDETNKSLGARIDETNKSVQSIDSRLRTVEQGQARLQGLVEGLRAMVSGRRSAA